MLWLAQLSSRNLASLRAQCGVVVLWLYSLFDSRKFDELPPEAMAQTVCLFFAICPLNPWIPEESDAMARYAKGEEARSKFDTTGKRNEVMKPPSKLQTSHFTKTCLGYFPITRLYLLFWNTSFRSIRISHSPRFVFLASISGSSWGP
jgi:hypothetical protein